MDLAVKRINLKSPSVPRISTLRTRPKVWFLGKARLLSCWRVTFQRSYHNLSTMLPERKEVKKTAAAERTHFSFPTRHPSVRPL